MQNSILETSHIKYSLATYKLWLLDKGDTGHYEQNGKFYEGMLKKSLTESISSQELNS